MLIPLPIFLSLNRPLVQPPDLRLALAISGSACLHRLADDDVALAVAGHCTPEEQQVALLVDLDHVQVLYRGALDAVMAGHLLALRNTLGGAVLPADAALATVALAVAVAHGLAVEAVALDGAGETTPLGDSGDVHLWDELPIVQMAIAAFIMAAIIWSLT